MTAALVSAPSSTNSQSNRSAPSRSIQKIPRIFGSVPANHGPATASRLATASTNPSDGGETWTNAGLPKSERIAEIAISPKNSDTVFAGVPGALWSDSADRGLYRTADGGKNWKLALKGSNLSTGCSTVVIDPKDPNVMFAALWDFRRKGWTFRSGGDGPNEPSGSGLFRSDDGGNTWNEITPENSKGFPKKPYGRIAVAIAPSNCETRLRFCRINRQRALRFRRWRAAPGTSATRASGWFGGRFTSPI